MSEIFRMPIMEGEDRRSVGKVAPRFVWPVTDAHRERAKRTHSQSLERLRERGGLDWVEMHWVLAGLGWHGDDMSEADAKAHCLTIGTVEGRIL